MNDPDEPTIEERTIAHLERKLALLRAACRPLIAIATDIRNHPHPDTVTLPIPLGVCRAIAGACGAF